jgi:hypothetical protein
MVTSFTITKVSISWLINVFNILKSFAKCAFSWWWPRDYVARADAMTSYSRWSLNKVNKLQNTSLNINKWNLLLIFVMLFLKIQHVCDGFSRDVLPFENPVGFSLLDFHICFLSFFFTPHENPTENPKTKKSHTR